LTALTAITASAPCPVCGHMLNPYTGAWAPRPPDRHEAKEGDVCVCIECLAALSITSLDPVSFVQIAVNSLRPETFLEVKKLRMQLTKIPFADRRKR
jgi:hypothetical protein